MAVKKQAAARSNKSSMRDSLMARFSLVFYKKTRLTLLLWIILLIGGVASYTSLLPREGFPPVQVPYTITTGSYLVDDAAKVDEDITRPVAELFLDVDGVKEVTTRTDANFFTITTQFDNGVSSDDGTARIRQAISDASLMPEEATINFATLRPALFINKYDIFVSVYDQPDSSPSSLEEKAQTVAGELRKNSAVNQAEVQSIFETGENPENGQSVREQRSFDRIGVQSSQNNLEFYPSVSIGIIGNDSLDAIELSESVRRAVSTLTVEDATVTVSADLAPNIRTQINSLENNVLTGLLVVAVLTLVLISWRASLVTALFMITVMVTTIFVLNLIGYTLNTVSLFALVLALGLFVDDATIVVEAIDANRRKRKSKREMLKAAISQVGAATSTGTITTVLLFLSLAFVSGILGDFIRILPVTVIIALVTSLILSLALIPFWSRYILLRKPAESKRSPMTKLEHRLSDWLSRPTMVFEHNRRRGILISSGFITLSLAVIGVSVAQAQQLEFNIFPSTKDSNQLSLSINFPPDNTLVEAEEIARETETVVQQTAGQYITDVSYSAASVANQRSATLLMELIPYTDRDKTSVQIVDELELAFADFEPANVQIIQVDVGPPDTEFPFQVQIYGENQAQTQRLAEDVRQFLDGRELERPNGTTATIVNSEVQNTEQIVRQNGERYVQVASAFDAEDISALVREARTQVEQQFGNELETTYGLTSEALIFDFGQETENQESFSSLIKVGPIAVLVMYLLLAIQFRSLLQPLLIFLAIPFSLFGVVYGLKLTDNPISFFTMVGFFGLMGIVVNNTILLTDYANRERRAGKSMAHAVSAATRKRFRPLMATSLTTVAALIPLALTDPFWEALAVTVIFGLISSTILVILAFPHYYLLTVYLWHITRRVLRRAWIRGRQTLQNQQTDWATKPFER